MIRDDVRRRLAEVVLFSDAIPDETPVPKVRKLVERLTDITMRAMVEFGNCEVEYCEQVPGVHSSPHKRCILR